MFRAIVVYEQQKNIIYADDCSKTFILDRFQFFGKVVVLVAGESWFFLVHNIYFQRNDSASSVIWDYFIWTTIESATFEPVMNMLLWISTAIPWKWQHFEKTLSLCFENKLDYREAEMMMMPSTFCFLLSLLFPVKQEQTGNGCSCNLFMFWDKNRWTKHMNKERNKNTALEKVVYSLLFNHKYSTLHKLTIFPFLFQKQQQRK